MAKKKILACPACRARLLEDCIQGTGLFIVCPQCGASVLADIDDIGRMRLIVDPQPEGGARAESKPQPQQSNYRR